MAKNEKCIVNFPAEHWKEISQEAQDLIKLMLSRNPKDRPNAAEALKHSWFNKGSKNTTKLVNAVENMKKYSSQ